MPTINNSTKKTLSAVFDKTIFNIPRYQRAYSWEENNWRELWDDIKNTVIEKDKEHFIGAIIYYHSSKNTNRFSHYDIVDGQQRLTTITILMRVLYEKLRQNSDHVYLRFSEELYEKYIGDKKEDAFFLNLSKKDEKFFKDYVQEIKSVRSKQGKLVSNRNIRKCFDFFNERINEFCSNFPEEKPEEICWNLKKKIELNLIFVVIDVTTDVDAYTIFESINSKRQGLTTSDLLKNYIFSAADQFEKNKPDSKKLSSIEDSWDQMEQELDKIETNQYIRHYWISNYGKVFEKELYQQIKLKLQNNYNEIIGFFSRVVEESENYSSIVNADVKDFPPEGNHALEQLKQLRNRQYYPLILSALYSKKFLVNDISELVKTIASVAVRRSIIGKNPNELETFFTDNASRLRRGDASLSGLIEELKNSYWISDEDILKELKSLSFEDQEYLAKFILHEYEISRGVEEKKIGKVSLEHVLPRNPEELKDWNISEEKKKELVWNIGNLALIGQTYNNKMSNKSFVKKAPWLKKTEIQTTKEIGSQSDWTEDTILFRNDVISKFVIKCWKK